MMRTAAMLSFLLAMGAEVADFDRDGRDDVLLVFPNPDTFALVLSQDAQGEWQHRQRLVLAAEVSQSAQFRVREEFDGPHLYVMQAAALQEYAGWPLRLVRETPGAMAGSRFEIADLDGDGDDEIASLVSGVLTVFDFGSGMSLGTPVGGTASDFTLAQLDNDPALEVILSRLPGQIVDGATWAAEWSYLDGLSDALFGRFGAAPGSAKFFARTGNYYEGRQAFAASPYSPIASALWSNGAVVADVDRDGVDELLQLSSNKLRVNSAAGIALREFALPDSFASLPRFGDFQGGGHGGFVYLSKSTDQRIGQRLIYQPDGADAPHTALELAEHAFHALVVGDVDADGEDEIVTGTSWSTGILFVLDARTGRKERRLVSADHYDAAAMRYLDATLAQLDDDSALEIVLAGRGPDGATVVIRDGATLQVEREFTQDRSSPYGPFQGAFDVEFAQVLDVEGNGMRELVTFASGSTPHWSLQILPLQAGAAVPAGNVFPGEVRQWLAVQVDADAAVEILVLSEGRLIAWDAVKAQEEWSLATDANAFAIRDAGTSQAELLLAGDAALRRHDLATRTLLQEHALDRPAHGVAALAGSPGWVMLAHHDDAALFDTGHDLELARSEPLPVPDGWNLRRLQVQASRRGWETTVVDPAGYARFFTWRPELMFGDGFD